MAAAPALITASGAQCTLADARFVGDSVDAKTKAKSSLYEVACTGAEGLLILEAGPPGTPPSTFTCMEAATPGPDGKPRGAQCILPGNLDPKAGLAPYIAKAGIVCTPDKVRALGHSSTNVYFELACHEGGGGYILQTSSPPSARQAGVREPLHHVRSVEQRALRAHRPRHPAGGGGQPGGQVRQALRDQGPQLRRRDPEQHDAL